VYYFRKIKVFIPAWLVPPAIRNMPRFLLALAAMNLTVKPWYRQTVPNATRPTNPWP